METKRRSLLKSLSWRVIGLFDLAIQVFILAGIFTNLIELALIIPLTHFATRFIEYYFHERLWSRIKWGYKDD